MYPHLGGGGYLNYAVGRRCGHLRRRFGAWQGLPAMEEDLVAVPAIALILGSPQAQSKEVFGLYCVPEGGEGVEWSEEGGGPWRVATLRWWGCGVVQLV